MPRPASIAGYEGLPDAASSQVQPFNDGEPPSNFARLSSLPAGASLPRYSIELASKPAWDNACQGKEPSLQQATVCRRNSASFTRSDFTSIAVECPPPTLLANGGNSGAESPCGPSGVLPLLPNNGAGTSSSALLPKNAAGMSSAPYGRFFNNSDLNMDSNASISVDSPMHSRRSGLNTGLTGLLQFDAAATGSSRGATNFSEIMKFLVVGDTSVEDKWQPSMTTGSGGGGRSARESGIVAPLNVQVSSLSAKDEAVMNHRLLHQMSMAVIDKTVSFRTLVWYYFQTFVYSIVVASPIFIIVFCLSKIPWHLDNPIPGALPAFSPNQTAIAWTTFMQAVTSLAVYAVCLYMAMNRTLRVPWQLVAVCSGVILYSLVTCVLYWHYNFAFWFYYLDVVLIVTVYLPCTCMVGWLSAGEHATTRQRWDEVLYVAIVEAIIATAGIVYAVFIMPHFYTLKSAWLQLLWACVLHQLYFELTTAAIVRKTLHRQVALGRHEVVHFLPVIHMNVHQVGMAFSLQASIEPINIIVLSLFCLQIGKLLWRSTVLWRDLLVERMWRRQWSFQYDPEQRCEITKIISLAVLTELILDNAAVISAPFLLWVMYKEPIFMSVVPNTFFNSEGTYPIGTMFAIIGLMLAFTWAGDIVFFTVNYNWGQCLPIIFTWRRIKDAKWAYLGFLAYALATMGVTFNFAMLLLLPRAAYCKENDYCTCSLKSYEAICKGEFFSTLVDYLVG